jgi:hypothetical protein
MELIARWLLLAFWTLCVPGEGFGQKIEGLKKLEQLEKKKREPAKPTGSEEEPIDIDQVREELGVNEFTAPSIEQVLAELMDLRPIPIEKVWSDLPIGTPQNRARLALASGRVIADGLLAVIAEKPSRVEPCARALLRFAKGLGVADHVTKHSKSIIEKAAKENWLDVRRELVKAQADVESGMLALRDEEIAHLVSLGGWLRGLEIVSILIADDFSAPRAARLVQPEALDYFIDRISTLNPNLKAKALFQKIEEALKGIRGATVKPNEMPLNIDDVKKVRDITRELNARIAETGARLEE